MNRRTFKYRRYLWEGYLNITPQIRVKRQWRYILPISYDESTNLVRFVPAPMVHLYYLPNVLFAHSHYHERDELNFPHYRPIPLGWHGILGKKDNPSLIYDRSIVFTTPPYKPEPNSRVRYKFTRVVIKSTRNKILKVINAKQDFSCYFQNLTYIFAIPHGFEKMEDHISYCSTTELMVEMDVDIAVSKGLDLTLFKDQIVHLISLQLEI
jgi:hypothetical protein